jgi:UDP-N-acetylglucosamine--N-acetylmuramyl-(pentapeptide) pyrophosphoryl-undecaprenol N-acetylglucosamine transferase
MRVVVTGGGTYGHVSPLEPIVASLKKDTADKVEVMFIAQKNDRFAELLSAPEHVDSVIKISAGKYRRYPNESRFQRLLDVRTHLLNARDVFFIIAGTIKAYFILRKFKPDVVFGKGGYVSVPVGWAAHFLNIPLVIHESDTRPGMANKLLSKYARGIALGLPTDTNLFDKAITKFTGIPVRESFKSDGHNKADIKRLLKLDTTLPLITVSGGSLGAKAINDAIIQNLGMLTEKTQLVHITGESNLTTVMTTLQKSGQNTKNYRAVGFTKELDLYFKASDLVITRASATTFSELAVLGVATILIPASQLDDQIENARVLKEKGVVETVSENEIDANPKYLPELALAIINEPSRISTLQTAIKSVAKPNAASELAQMIKSAATEVRK